jgi:NAD(P)-dependent dehydrogenase (short-subunit alcohol dehydrogenase family)
MTPLSQQTILITGATDGLGRHLAEHLARSGARLLLHGRDPKRGADTVRAIHAATGNARLEFVQADFASLDEVRAMAARLAAELPRLDALVNNAGVGSGGRGAGPRALSRDGIELRFAVNYLAPFVLTRALLALLERSAPARIVNVASAGQQALDFDDLMLERGYSGWRAYCQSKLAQILFTFDLADEMRGKGVTVNCLHPSSLMPTKMVLQAYGYTLSTIEQGVEATARLVADPALDAVTGRYFDVLREAKAEAQAYDSAARHALRTATEQMAGIKASSVQRR